MSTAPLTAGPMAPIFEPLADAHLQIGAPGSDDRVLDVASGTGIVARRCASSGVASVLASDPNRARLQIAQRGLPSLACVTARAEALPLANGSFSWVPCQHGVMFFSDVARGLREIRRVLVPGGRTTLTAWSAVTRSVGFDVLNGALGREVGEDARRNAAVPFSIPDPDEIAQPLRDIGFGDVVCHPIEIDVRYPSARDFALSFVGATSLAQVVARAGENAANRVADIVDDELGWGPAPFHFVAHAYCVAATAPYN